MSARMFKYLVSVSISVAGCGSVTTGQKSGEPTIDTVAPDQGSVVGGTMVTLTGKNFGSAGESGNTLVLVGGHPATNVMVASDTQLTFTAPAGEREGDLVDVTVSSSHGFGSKANAYKFNFKPLVLSITPQSGKAAGGTMVTITGRGFSGGSATISIGGGIATNVTVVDDKTITAVTGPITAGTPTFSRLDVTVTTPNGPNTLAKSYVATTQGLIALGMQNRCCGDTTVFFVDPTTAAVTQISTTQHAHACAADSSGLLYSVTGVNGNPLRRLVTIDPITGTQSVVGLLQETSNVNHNPTGLVFNGTTLFGIDTGIQGVPSNRLVSIDKMTARVTIIGATAQTFTQRNVAIGVKDAASVFVLDNITGTFDSMPIATSVRAAGPAMSGASADTRGVRGVVNTGSALFVANSGLSGNPTIYSVTLGATAVLTPVATLPFTIVGLCQTPANF